MRQGLALLVAAAALAGCARMAHQAYDGPSRPEREVAFLQGGGAGDQMSPHAVLEYGAVDGRLLRGSPYVISVLPGPRTFGVKQTLTIGASKRVQYCAFSMEIAPGCVYTPRPPTLPPDAIGRAASWEWSVELPVGIECGGGGAFMLRTPARCGTAERLLEERNPR